MIERHITLYGRSHFGYRVPPVALAPILDLVPSVIRQTVRMRIEGRSWGHTNTPVWLDQAADIRFLGHRGQDETVLSFEMPTIQEAVPYLFTQPPAWPTPINATQDAFDLFADVLRDIQRNRIDSEMFDWPLLKSISSFGSIIQNEFPEIEFVQPIHTLTERVVVNAEVVHAAQTLLAEVPPTRQIRLFGVINNIG